VRETRLPSAIPPDVAVALRGMAEVVLAINAGDLSGVPEGCRGSGRCPRCGDCVTFAGFWAGLPEHLCKGVTDGGQGVRCPYARGAGDSGASDR
jgi:hypothetical protein